MELQGKDGCSFGGEVFDYNSELCIAEECFICNDGEWELTGVAGI